MALSNPILILLLLVTARCAVAQPSQSSLTNDDKDLYGQNFNAATAILIVVIVSAFFFLAFFSVYFRRCYRDRSAVVPATGATGIAASRRGARRGLDPAVIETFPTLTYSVVTGLKIGKETLECAVCLSEFSDDETLRMLPKCCHVFHPECIDTWLASHVTCPVCRDNLSVVPSDPEVGPEVPPPEETDGTGDSGNNSPVDVAVDLGVNRIMGRSHTVGHVSGGVDRFTLRLPEHVRREIVAAGSLRRSASVAVFRGGGEGSTRRGYRGRSGMWAGLSDRWASGILARVSTWRRGEGEGSVRKGEVAEGSMRGGMFDCLGGGGGDRGESSSSAVDDEEAPMRVSHRV